MRTVKAELKKGLKVGDTVHTTAEIREATAGDLIEATEESEKLYQAPDGSYVLVASSTMVGLNTMRRQIVRIGDHSGPLTMGELKSLSAADINILQAESNKLDGAVIAEVADRGRDHAA
jgi:phage FluMu protein gp41